MTAKKENDERALLVEISQKLDRLIGIVAIQGRDVDAQIEILTRFGFSSAEIGVLVGLHEGAVRKRRATKGKRSG